MDTRLQKPVPGASSCWSAGEKGESLNGFYMNVLPFAEDIRQAHFASFGTKPELTPTEQQVTAMAALVDSMDLAGTAAVPCCHAEWLQCTW